MMSGFRLTSASSGREIFQSKVVPDRYSFHSFGPNRKLYLVDQISASGLTKNWRKQKKKYKTQANCTSYLRTYLCVSILNMLMNEQEACEALELKEFKINQWLSKTKNPLGFHLPHGDKFYSIVLSKWNLIK